MALWVAVHLKVSPVNNDIQKLSDWQIGLIYETAMNYPVDGLRQSYLDAKKTACNFDDNDLMDFGYTPEDIAVFKGNR